MPPYGPISRTNLIRGLRALGFDGPYPGGSHAYMVHNAHRIAIPNPHQGTIGINLLARILRQANITREEWEAIELSHDYPASVPDVIASIVFNERPYKPAKRRRYIGLPSTDLPAQLDCNENSGAPAGAAAAGLFLQHAALGVYR